MQCGHAERWLTLPFVVVCMCVSSPVGVILFNHSDSDFHVKVGDRVAQLILERIAIADVEEVEGELEVTSVHPRTRTRAPTHRRACTQAHAQRTRIGMRLWLESCKTCRGTSIWLLAFLLTALLSHSPSLPVVPVLASVQRAR